MTASLDRPLITPPLDSIATDTEALYLVSQMCLYERAYIAVEAGTYKGHGTLLLASALRAAGVNGHLWTADPVDCGVDEYLAKNDLTAFATYFNGDYLDMLKVVPKPIDFAFIDASDHAPDSDRLMRVHHLVVTIPLMRPGGIVCLHDTGGLRGDWAGRELIRNMGGLNLRGPRGLTVLQIRDA